MCSFSWGGFFGGGPLSHSLAESSHGGVPIQMVFYILSVFFRWGVCGLRRCRSAIQLIELLVVLSRPGVVWYFVRYHCNHTHLNTAHTLRQLWYFSFLHVQLSWVKEQTRDSDLCKICERKTKLCLKSGFYRQGWPETGESNPSNRYSLNLLGIERCWRTFLRVHAQLWIIFVDIFWVWKIWVYQHHISDHSSDVLTAPNGLVRCLDRPCTHTKEFLVSTVYTNTTYRLHTFILYFPLIFRSYILAIIRWSTCTEGRVLQKKPPL